ncbi:MAG: glutamate racemase [Treponema sp.]|nr:glutamate racemase [Treponema sp.]
MKFVILDSGTGGIPYMKSIKAACPEAECIYVADAAHFPYGTKSQEEVVACASAVIALILERWAPDVIVIACNTISVTALTQLRGRFPHVPIVGTVPAIKLAAKISEKRTIGILATEGTINHQYTKDLINQFASDCTVVTRADTTLVSFIEHHLYTATKEERLEAVRPAVSYFSQQGCDTIVLACTHFVHMTQDIAEVAGSDMHIVDSRDGVARQALKVCSCVSAEKKDSLLSALSQLLAGHPADQSLFVTGFTSDTDFSEYQALCVALQIPWGGLLK